MQKNNKKHNQETPDINLVRKINETGDEESLRALSDRHAPLIASMISRLAKRFNNWSIVEDLIQERHLIVYTAAKKFNPSKKTKFSTFLGNETKWAYLNRCSAQKKINRHVPTDSDTLENRLVGEEFPLKSIMDKDTLSYIFKILDRHPDRRMSKIFTMRYIIGKRNKVMPWHLVGSGVGLSAQGCINIHRTGINFIKEEINKEERQKC